MPPHDPTRPLGCGRLLTRLLALALLLLASALAPALAAHGEREPSLSSQFWVDESGAATVEDVVGGSLRARFEPLESQRSLPLGTASLWLRVDLPSLEPSNRWFLLLPGAAFTNRASLFTQDANGRWREQRAGDHVPVSRWDHPHVSPLFEVSANSGSTVWMRLQNQPAPTSTFLQIVSEDDLQYRRQWTFLLLGCYLGFGMLVFVLGMIHARLYGDRVFDAYCVYVACMLLFQMSFTGMAGLFFWPRWAWFNDAAPALFMLWMTGAGIWFIREATALARHSRRVDRFAVGFSIFGLAFPSAYLLINNAATYAVLNLYGLMSVVLSLSLCFWTWRRGETYSGWLLLGFLPIHLSYPFPALRAAGVLPDSWITQYAVLIGSAIEIPLLLYILHRRAKDFSENRARLRALDSTDPLTGLTIAPVLHLRLRDALRRAQRSEHRCAMLMVEVANHGDIVAHGGREAGDRALVVAASRIGSVVRDVDTVCRIADTRFAILLEGPQPEHSRRLQAQHIIAKGLERVSGLPPDLPLRLRVVSSYPPDGTIELSPEGQVDADLLLSRMNWALDRLAEDPKKVVLHLEPRVPGVEPRPLAAA